MPEKVKKIAIVGANKEALSLLPFILQDTERSRLMIIADPNQEALLFKLKELGYRIAAKYGVITSGKLGDLKDIGDLDIIIDALQDPATEKFLEQPEFRDVEKLGPLSARLIWKTRATAAEVLKVSGAADGQEALLGSLREIVDAVRLSIDRRELLSVILKLAIESTAADRGSIMILSRDEGQLRVEIAKGMDEEIIRKIKVPLGEGISGKVAEEGQPLLISGKADSQEFDRLKDREDVKSALCVPLSVNGDVIGVMNVNSSSSALAFSGDDLEFLSRLSSLASEVIHRSNEYERMRVDSAKLKLWKEADFILSSVIPLGRRLTTICRKLSGIIPGLTCFIYVYEEEQKRLTLQAGSIKEIRKLGPLHLTAGEGIEGWGIENMHDVVLVDRVQEENLKRVYLSLPMVADSHFIGTLNCHVISPKGLSAYHESLLRDMRVLIGERLHKQSQSEKTALQTKKMFAVDETGLEMVTMKDSKRLLHIMTTSPAAILGAEGSSLRLQADPSSPYRIMGSYGLEDKVVRDYYLPIEKEVVMEVLRKKGSVKRVFSEEASPYVRAVLSQPLRLDERIVGAITLFNKVDDGAMPPCAFSKTDAKILSRFAVYAEKSLKNVFGEKEKPSETKKVEPPVSMLGLFEVRIAEEINRAGRAGQSLVVMTIHIAGLMETAVQDKVVFESRILSFLKEKIRNFDMMVWLDEETIGILFCDTDHRVKRILGDIPRVMGTEEDFYRSFQDGRVEVHYGYASYPEDGRSFSELFTRASGRVKVKFREPAKD